MPRIRTIKPEFPQSESMGRVSRDARLTFVQLWTLADDSGRLRGNSRMLASLLFPYDDDAPSLIDGWLEELEGEGCIVRYKVSSDTYIAIAKWLIHQKIDKPSPSKNPSPNDGSRILANPRESSLLDQGSRIKEGIKDQGEDQGSSTKEIAPRKRVAPPLVSKPDSVDQQTWDDWLDLRKRKRAPVTATVLDGAISEADKASMSLDAFLRIWCYRGSQGLQAEWIKQEDRARVGLGKQSALEARNAAVAARWLKERENEPE